MQNYITVSLMRKLHKKRNKYIEGVNFYLLLLFVLNLFYEVSYIFNEIINGIDNYKNNFYNISTNRIYLFVQLML